ncbi:hypothetical protein O6H91_09G040800 [Diphasiastrum complanatum]|uniref:Uncharacterized protein n=1 Tax=Diphasiastrum complanatum TaxID=34168 RepID=A0ACC2CNJ3_DIPCM|nr:hypothetical protein O6H91_09G040800 [Diphasiastrum complanatum]
MAQIKFYVPALVYLLLLLISLEAAPAALGQQNACNYGALSPPCEISYDQGSQIPTLKGKHMTPACCKTILAVPVHSCVCTFLAQDSVKHKCEKLLGKKKVSKANC